MLVKTLYIGQTLVLEHAGRRATLGFGDVPYSFFDWREIWADDGTVAGRFVRALSDRGCRDNAWSVSVAIDAPEWSVRTEGRRLNFPEIQRLADAKRGRPRPLPAWVDAPPTVPGPRHGGPC